MVRPSHPTRHVFTALRRALVMGDLLPGAALPITELSERFALSPTPVREALARLSGEGLVTVAVGGGYACAPLDPFVLASLRRLERRLLDAASPAPDRRLDDLAQRLSARSGARGSLAEETYWLWGEIVGAAGDAVLSAAFAAVSARLGVVRRVEASQGAQELADIAQAFARAGTSGREVLDRYFERRRGQEAQTCDAVRRLIQEAHAD